MFGGVAMKVVSVVPGRGFAGVVLAGLLAWHAPVALAQASFKSLHSFNTADGALPQAALTQVGKNFYGSTQYGGSVGAGTVFRMTSKGQVTVLHSFVQDGVDGQQPHAKLLLASDGLLYGCTQKGGTAGDGTLFSISPSGVYKVIYQFDGSAGGPAQPAAPLIQTADGNFVGTTYQGGTGGTGTIFRVTPSGSLTVLHNLGATDGGLPTSGVTLASDGNYYGTTTSGGSAGYGTAYRLTPAGVFSVLHNFIYASSGSNPWGGLVQASDGNLYGTTGSGGDNGVGTLFRLTPSGTLTKLFSFGSGLGANPTGTLAVGADGLLYGTTYQTQVPYNAGTVFKATLAGVVSTVFAFPVDQLSGANPWAGVTVGKKGRLYGTTVLGGEAGVGTVYRLTP
jgi:uncharacterized repeat protein (TIGR03803 family)